MSTSVRNDLLPIALLTDFGLRDAYVGVMKGVIATLAARETVIDITHAVEPQNVAQGAALLAEAYRYFPPGTIFVAIVDPGVGSARRAIAAQIGDYTFVAPDNGLLTEVLADTESFTAVTLTNPAYHLVETSATFHGRDIFAPAAAHLANGVPLHDLGDAISDLVRLPPLLTLDMAGAALGRVSRVDHFGNLITTIGRLHWLDGQRLDLSVGDAAPIVFDTRRAMVQIEGTRITRFVHTYTNMTDSDSHMNDLIALVSSGGALEIALNRGSAAATLNVGSGATVTLRWEMD